MGIEQLFDGSLEVEIPAEVVTPVEPEPVAEAPVEVPVEPAPVVAEPEAKQPHVVPLAVLHEVRDELKETKRQLAAMQEQRQAAPAEAPDPYDDPQGFAAHQNAQVERALVAQRFQTSDLIARQQHGAETVEAAAAWATERASKDPGFAQSYMQQPHPIDWIVQQHKRDGLLQQIGEDPDEYVRRRAAELGLIAPAPIAPALPVAQQQQAPVPTPPRSLASVPSKGGAIKDVPTGPMASLGAVFQG